MDNTVGRAVSVHVVNYSSILSGHLPATFFKADLADHKLSEATEPKSHDY